MSNSLLDLTVSGALRCEINNGGCWKGTQNGRTYSACIVSSSMHPLVKALASHVFCF